MALVALSPDYTFVFIPECERGKKDPTKFHLRPKDAKVYGNYMAEFQNAAVSNKGEAKKIEGKDWNARDKATFVAVVKRIENMYLEKNGKLITLIEDSETIGKLYHQLPYTVIQEIIEATESSEYLPKVEKKS